MKCHVILPLFAAAVLLIAAFSVGSPVFLLLAVLLLLVMGLSLAAVLTTARTLRVQVLMDETHVVRGDDVRLKVVVHSGGVLPVAPIAVAIRTTPDAEPTVLHLSKEDGRRQRTVTTLHAGHIGVSHPGVESCTVEDLFGLFTMVLHPQDAGTELMVVPQTFEIAALTYAPGDAGVETMARATEDISSPSDVRAYAAGDPMKKIHWKLSLRKRELLVRRYEEPALPDALVLMDCSAPRAETREQEADLRDALLETAASVMAHPHEEHTVRLPLMGSHPTQLMAAMGMPLVMENLARLDFSETDKFERVLMMEARRLTRVGSVVIIVSGLNGSLVETISRIRRTGPVVRVYLITENPEDERVLKYISRLQRATV